MKFLTLLATAAVSSSAAAAGVTRCGTADPPETLKFALNQAAFKAAIYRNGTTRTVDTYAHVVTTEQKEGTYTEQQVADQIAVMNTAYGPSGFQFNLLDTDFTANDAWAAAGQGSQTELEMKAELHKGTYENLNLYFLSDLGGGLLGFCYFPLEDPAENDLTLDGCVNLAGTLPGADEQPDYALGLTTVHETGHVSCLHSTLTVRESHANIVNSGSASSTSSKAPPAPAPVTTSPTLPPNALPPRAALPPPIPAPTSPAKTVFTTTWITRTMSAWTASPGRRASACLRCSIS